MSSTNNDPKVIAWYYLKGVERQKVSTHMNVSLGINITDAPKLLCCDCGTENGVVAYLQPFLCGASTGFRYVKSVSNQVLPKTITCK